MQFNLNNNNTQKKSGRRDREVCVRKLLCPALCSITEVTLRYYCFHVKKFIQSTAAVMQLRRQFHNSKCINVWTSRKSPLPVVEEAAVLLGRSWERFSRRQVPFLSRLCIHALFKVTEETQQLNSISFRWEIGIQLLFVLLRTPNKPAEVSLRNSWLYPMIPLCSLINLKKSLSYRPFQNIRDFIQVLGEKKVCLFKKMVCDPYLFLIFVFTLHVTVSHCCTF